MPESYPDEFFILSYLDNLVRRQGQGWGGHQVAIGLGWVPGGYSAGVGWVPGGYMAGVGWVQVAIGQGWGSIEEGGVRMRNVVLTC